MDRKDANQTQGESSGKDEGPWSLYSAVLSFSERVWRAARRAFSRLRRSVEDQTLAWFVGTSVLIYAIIFIQQVATGADSRLVVYLLQSALVFFLPLALANGRNIKRLTTASDRVDVLLFAVGFAALLTINLALHGVLGLSPRLGFVDASALLLLTLVLYFGRKQLREFALPLSLLLVLVIVVAMVSNENQIFIDVAGGPFISMTVAASASVLQFLGVALTTGSDYYVVQGATSLRVEVGVRCAGLDVALIYSLILASFLWQSPGSVKSKSILLALGVVGALGVNVFRVVVLTLLYATYGAPLGDTVHTHLGDLLFLGYIGAFWWVARGRLNGGSLTS